MPEFSETEKPYSKFKSDLKSKMDNGNVPDPIKQ